MQSCHLIHPTPFTHYVQFSYLSEILTRRDFLLEQFFYMKQLAGTDASLEPEQDLSKIDVEKLKAFQEEHRLSEYVNDKNMAIRHSATGVAGPFSSA